MLLRDRMFGFGSHSLTGVLLVLATSPVFAGNNNDFERVMLSAPFQNPHTAELELTYTARRRDRHRLRIEQHDFLELTPGLQPLEWPRNTDMRARLLTPELRRTPFLGWIAQNLYRSKSENGWCLEVDPGEGEYAVLYRLHLR
jgi:hypothetical protein